jgi:signal transduction histidine kinase/CheY-like chemotaxis protein
VATALERQRERATHGLLQASQAVFAAREPDQMAQVIVQTATEVMRGNASLLLPGADGRLYVAGAFGLSPEIQAQVSIPLGERVAGRVALDRTPVLLQDLSKDPRFANLAPSSHVKSSIVYPLAVGDRVVGVLAFNRGERDRPFHRADLHRASLFASLVLLALENVRLMRQTVAAERLASLGQLAASVTHEINNPLTYVLGNLERLAELTERAQTAPGPTERGQLLAQRFDEIQAAVRDAIEGSERIGQMVRDMRTVARTGTAEATVFDLAEVVRSAMRLGGAGLRASAEVVLRLGEQTLVRGSAGQLTQVFVNLLANAGQSIRESGRGGRVTVTTARAGDEVVATVSDTGKGVDERDQARLFEPFFTTRGPAGGTGLGLWISKEILRRHGGSIELESTAGQGATFRVHLPAAGASSLPEPTADSPSSRARVLFVDDEEAILRLYQRCLEQVCEVEIALGGLPALKRLTEDSAFDTVVCDLLMPDLSGMDLYAKVCAQKPDLAERFIFVTGSIWNPRVQEFLSTCRCSLLEKPLDLLALRTLIERHRARQSAQGGFSPPAAGP